MKLFFGALFVLFASAGSVRGDALSDWTRLENGFFDGAGVVAGDLGTLLIMVAAGLLIGIWKKMAIPATTPALIVGVFAGLVLSVADLTDPVATGFIGAMIFGLLGAAALPWPGWMMQGMVFVAGLFLSCSVLGGHEPGDVPALVYAGVSSSMIAGVLVIAALISFLRELIAQGWLLIACRAIASWVVAVAIMVFVFTFRT